MARDNNFINLLGDFLGVKKATKLKPMTAIKAMLKANCYSCLCHPVCCKYLKAKWMDFGWKIYSVSLIIYLVYLISLNVYAFNIPTYEVSEKNKGKMFVKRLTFFS